MKFIDENGRLFGRINLIDFMVLIFLFSLIPLFFYSFKLFHKSNLSLVKEYVNIVVPCNAVKIPLETIPLIHSGDLEVDALGSVKGKITEVGAARPYVYNLDMGDGNIRKLPNALFKEIPLKIELRCEKRLNKIYYNNQLIQVTAGFTFKTPAYSLNCIPMKNFALQWLQIKVNFNGISPEISKMIASGHIEKNNEDLIIAKLKEIVSSSNARLPVIKMEEKSLIYVNDPSRDDIVAKLDVLCDEKDGGLFFKSFPVKVGSQITFISDSYLVSGTIIAIDLRNEKSNP